MKIRYLFLVILLSVFFIACEQTQPQEIVENKTEEIGEGKETVFTPTFNTGSEVIELPDIVSCVSDYDCNSICVGDDVQPRECIERSDDDVALALIDEYNVSVSKLEIYRDQLVEEIESGLKSSDRLDELDELIEYAKGELTYFNREEKWICTNSFNVDDICSSPLSCVEDEDGAYCSCNQDSDCGNVCGENGIISGVCENRQCEYKESNEIACTNGGVCVEGLEGSVCYNIEQCEATLPEITEGIEYDPIRMRVNYDGESVCQGGRVVKVSTVGVHEVEFDNSTPLIGYRTLIEERVCEKDLGRNAYVPEEGRIVTTSTTSEDYIDPGQDDYYGEIFEDYEYLSNKCLDENKIVLAYCDATYFFNTSKLESVDCSEFGEGFTCKTENGIGYCG